MKRQIKWLFVTSLVLSSFWLGISQAFASVRDITPNGSDQSSPDIYGDKVVWSDDRNGNWDIYMYDLSTDTETRITSNSSDQVDPKIYGDKIIWTDYRNGDSHYGENADIYMYDLTTHKETRITSDPNFHRSYSPEIYGDKIVWESTDGNNVSHIDLYDLSTHTQTEISSSPYTQSNPNIYGDNVIWLEHQFTNSTFDVHMYNLTTHAETIVTSIYPNPMDPWETPVIYENKIVWQDDRNGNLDIYLHDLTTNTDTKISSSLADEGSPAIYGDKIVWVSGDVYLYDLSTLKTTRISSDPDAHLSPKIYGNRVVWSNSHSGSSDIYVYAPDASVTRMAGADRYGTSAQISNQYPIASDTVVLAVGTNFPDALSGAPLATIEKAPILLTNTNSLPSAISAEITRRGAKHAILLGGEGAISAQVVDQLHVLKVTQVDRYAGMNRYETSAQVSQALLDKQTAVSGTHSHTAIIVTGQGYADALSASSPAGVNGYPILLVSTNEIPASIQQFIETNQITNFYIVGGTGAVSTAVEDQLKGYAGDTGMVTRLSGSSRYETSLNVAKEFWPTKPANLTAHLAFGANFPDALSQGALAAFMNSPLLLTKTASLEPSIITYLKTDPAYLSFYISGGTSVISQNVENQLRAIPN